MSVSTVPVVFLVDVDNTLLDNDRVQDDLKRHLEREFGAACRDRYWAILEALFVELGYRDYLGALSAPQGRAIRHPGGRGRPCVDLHPQGRSAG
jgi:hypothetical protein